MQKSLKTRLSRALAFVLAALSGGFFTLSCAWSPPEDSTKREVGSGTSPSSSTAPSLQPEQIPGFSYVAKNPQGYETYRHDQTRIVFVKLPGGKFKMGSPPGESRIRNLKDEGPVHEVTLSPFLIAECEVSQAEWKHVMGTTPSYFKRNERCPVDSVSWNDCLSFCQKTKLDLPTEAQWEYACRAGTTGPYAGELERMAWYEANCSGTQPVRAKEPNGFGLYDMHGNVSEWCKDFFAPIGFYATKEAGGPDPLYGLHSSLGRVLRGGSYLVDADACRSAYRIGITADDHGANYGFRPAESLRQEALQGGKAPVTCKAGPRTEEAEEDSGDSQCAGRPARSSE